MAEYAIWNSNWANRLEQEQEENELINYPDVGPGSLFLEQEEN